MIGMRYVRRNTDRLLRIAAWAALVALVLMIWSFHDSSPLVLVGFMVLGQSLGTLSLVLYLIVVFADVFGEDLAPAPPNMSREGDPSASPRERP
jgi:hypothetical protein